MPFMALMAAPLSAILSVTGDDGSLGYLSHARARTADNLFSRHHVSPTVPRRLGDDPLRPVPGVSPRPRRGPRC